MHELSIATSLITLATDAAAEAGSPPITAVRIRVGALSGVVVESLEFCWDIAREGTCCANASLEIERVPAVLRCEHCSTEFQIAPPHRFRCNECDRAASDVVSGRELDLVALELDDAPKPHHSFEKSETRA
ncbi:MAG: hydrogenase maturation nickel metallochaperone HypA [Planctomycetota bacterium]